MRRMYARQKSLSSEKCHVITFRDKPTGWSDLVPMEILTPQELAERDKEIAREAYSAGFGEGRMGHWDFGNYWTKRMELAEKKAHGEEKRRNGKGDE